MSEHMNDQQPSAEQPMGSREMSRRQFLSYTLGGTGAFMVSIPLLWSIRFAVDPLLQPKKESNWVKVVEASRITEEPQSFKFQVHVVDGWYEHDPLMEAWIARDGDRIYALSPVCKHLGCRVNWVGNDGKEFYCPCHDAEYTRLGKNLKVAPSPMDQYEVKVENGWVYLGSIKPNEIAR